MQACLNPSIQGSKFINHPSYMYGSFVCVEVLRPSQPNGVMSSAVNMYGYPAGKHNTQHLQDILTLIVLSKSVIFIFLKKKKKKKKKRIGM